MDAHLTSVTAEKLMAIMKALPDPAMVVRSNGTVAFINEHGERLSGYSREELAGRPLSILIPERFREAHQKSQRDYFKGLKARTMGTGLEFYLLRKDGTEVPVDISLGPVMCGEELCALAVIRNYSEHKEMQDALRKQAALRSLIAELSSTFINVESTEIDGHINHALKRIVGFLEIDHIAFYQFSEDGKTFMPTHSHGIAGPPPPSYIASDFHWYTAKLLAGETVVLTRLPDELPVDALAERQFCMESGLKSHLAIPLRVAGLNFCALGPAMFREERSWPEETIQGLRVLGEVLANALARKRADEMAQAAFAEIRQLKERLQAEVEYFQQESQVGRTSEAIIGQSDELKRVLFRVEQVAPGNTTVLILGETGTGKGLIASAIHNLSPRKNNPLITVNCASLPPNLIESELFGREKGAYTGAEAKQLGRFEIADGSTIFLDEIGDLPLELQAKLLRVVQSGEFERLGSSKTVKVDVRIIAATNRDLEEEARMGRFRRDLFYRLNVFPITLPPLRARMEDIPLLAASFLQGLNKKLGKNIKHIPVSVMRRLQACSWPGNVRELESIIERAVIVSTGSVLHLPEGLGLADMGDSEPVLASKASVPPGGKLADIERDHILRVLEDTKWRVEGKKGAAAILGLNPSTLRARMRKFDITR